MTIRRINVNSNEEYANMTVKVRNGNTIDVVFEFFADVKKLKIFTALNVPLYENDKDYQKEIFRASIDAEKMLKGIQKSYFTKVLMENYFKAIDFELKFPFKKVNIVLLVNEFHYLFHIRQGVYKITNWTIDDSKVPIIVSTNATLEIRFFGKVEGAKSAVYLMTSKSFYEIKKLTLF